MAVNHELHFAKFIIVMNICRFKWTGESLSNKCLYMNEHSFSVMWSVNLSCDYICIQSGSLRIRIWKNQLWLKGNYKECRKQWSRWFFSCMALNLLLKMLIKYVEGQNVITISSYYFCRSHSCGFYDNSTKIRLGRKYSLLASFFWWKLFYGLFPYRHTFKG